MDNEIRNEIIKTARDRYYTIANGSCGEYFDGVALLMYHLTTDGLKYHVVEIPKELKDSTDIGGLLEGALHDISDRTAPKFLGETVFSIMGAIPRDELENTLFSEQIEAEEFTELDLGFVLPGLIDNVSIIEVEDEEDPYERTSSSHGDYGPGNPWDAPGIPWPG